MQGVGFRPFIYGLAHDFGLKGWISNTSDGVHLEFNADENISRNFYNEIVAHPPPLAHLTSHCIKETASTVYQDFRIISCSKDERPILNLSPDFAMCKQCRLEIASKTNRRYKYAFTTCTQCGPRYSIFKKLPYDRENTVMEVFKMCVSCKAEYHDPLNRRHFSQTNSCPQCAIVMHLYDNKQRLFEEDQEKIIFKIAAFWNSGKIVALKGIGGYLLTCDASNKNAVEELRKRKHRFSKPFALMYPDINLLETEVHLNAIEKKELQSAAGPIVLLELKENQYRKLALDQIVPRLSKIGVMLPYTPLYQLLLQKFAKPIIATSGNISNAPIMYKDELALKELNVIADYILINDREILTPQDDSIVIYSKHYQHRIVLRRSRGFAPSYINTKLDMPPNTVLALGAILKSSFTLLKDKNIHLSQYLGDTGNYDSQKNYEKTLHHFLDIFQAEPEVILADKHPDYFTAQLGEQLAKKWGSQILFVQHHEAHFASVLGEHNLLESLEPILGVIWDGTGFGDDGHIWGAEFFTYEHRTFSRVAHFDYFRHILGDKMAREPRLSAFSVCSEIEEASDLLKPKFTETEWNIYLRMISSEKLKTSSAGRLFDAAASLLELCDLTSYEGEAAMLLEESANIYFMNGLNIPSEWLKNDPQEDSLSTSNLFRNLVLKIRKGINKSEIAAWFHVKLVLSIQKKAMEHHCRKICCSGGVFQNGLLIDLMIKILGDEYQLYFNKNMSPNDENISFGQLIWHKLNPARRKSD